MAALTHPHTSERFPLLTLLHPREYTLVIASAFVCALALAWLAVSQRVIPLWAATAAVLGVLVVVSVPKWRADALRFGPVAAVLCMILVLQGFHLVEHLVQWYQYHVLNWYMRAASGLISPANSEVVHFVWNWFVMLVVAFLVVGGMRNPWAWLLLAWCLLHTLEHSYMFARYLTVLNELRGFGITNVAAQGLPGVLGRDGLLATSAFTQGTFLCRLPGLTTAVRLDVHFWWNVGETILLLLAGHTYMRAQAVTKMQRAPQ